MRNWYRETAGHVRWRIDERIRKAVRPDEVMRDPSELLTFDERSYLPPTLLRFGREPDAGRVHVGPYSSINGGTRVLVGGNHHPEWVSTYPFRIRDKLQGAYEDGQPASRGPVQIGSDVWVGYDVVILSGVRIGHGAVVGAGSLVSKDIPPYAIVTGNPARIRRYRFASEEISSLLRIAWWDWPHDELLRNVHLLSSDRVADFITMFDPSGISHSSDSGSDDH